MSTLDNCMGCYACVNVCPKRDILLSENDYLQLCKEEQ